MKKRTSRKAARARRALIFLIIVIIVVLLGSVSTYTGYVYQKVKGWEDLIYPGLIVEDVDMSGKSLTEAKKILESKYGEVILKKKVNIATDSKVYTIDYSKLNAKYNIDSVVDEIFSYGKNYNMLKKYKLIKSPVQQYFKLKFTADSKYVSEVIQLMEKEINKNPVNAEIQMVSSGKFIVTPDVKGYKLQSEQLQKEIIDSINGELGKNINIKAIIKELTADITAEKLENIDTKISSFTTNYQTSSAERSYNIELSTKAINGTLLMPGDTFSFNDIVGERTAARGYKEAPVIIGNKVESGLGGGICQVSSTLYNAMLKTEVKSSQRVHHTLPSSYVALGLDATVDWGNIDYRFKNTLDYPIFIEGYTQNRNLYFNLYSNSSLTKRTYSITNEVYETINATVKTIDDPSLPLGQTVIEQKALNGFRVKVIKSIYENGTLVGTEVVSNDYYQPVQGIIKKGTRK
jgi:vancomycin resistance protein YoaR